LNTKIDHWEKVYQTKDESALSWFQERPAPSLGLILEFNRNCAAGIIDIGAGSSRLADTLAHGGFSDITLLDVSNTALAMTMKRLGENSNNVRCIIDDVTSWAPQRKWQVWHDRAVFHFLTKKHEQDAYIDVLVRATKPGSIVIFGTFAPDGPEKCSGLPVQRYSGEGLKKRLGPGFDLLKTTSYIHSTPNDAEQKFTYVVFRRR
jgi:SAM-dependent methyltransferase